MNVVEVARSCCGVAFQRVIGHLLADCAELLDRDHSRAVGVDRVIVEFQFDLSCHVLELAKIDGKYTLLLGANNKRVAA